MVVWDLLSQEYNGPTAVGLGEGGRELKKLIFETQADVWLRLGLAQNKTG